MKKRKLILIIANLVLIGILVVQLILSSKDGAKYYKFDDSVDEISIKTSGENIHLLKEGENWFIGEKKYLANTIIVENFIEKAKSIRTIEKVSNLNKLNAIDKYEFNEGQKISVEVKNGGKILRSFEIGKNATASSQSYVMIDGNKDIYLASGGLRGGFETSISDLRSKVVWEFEKSDVNSVSLTDENGKTWSLSKMGSEDDVVWNISGEIGIEVDSQKAQSWFDSVAFLSTTKWYNENENTIGNLISTVKITHGFENATLEIYEIPQENEESQKQYFGKTNILPYKFELAAYSIEKFTKKVEDIKK